MREGILDGLVLIHRFEPEVVRALAREYRLVTLTHVVYGQPVDHIDVNHGAAIAGLVDRMYDVGHRRFGFIGRRPELAYNQVRFGSFAAAMARLALPIDPASLVNVFSLATDLDEVADVVAERIRAGVTGIRAGQGGTTPFPAARSYTVTDGTDGNFGGVGSLGAATGAASSDRALGSRSSSGTGTIPYGVVFQTRRPTRPSTR